MHYKGCIWIYMVHRIEMVLSRWNRVLKKLKKLGICEIAFSGLQKNKFSHNEVNNVGNLCMFGSIFFFPFLD